MAMILDDTAIVAAHRQLIVNGNLGDAYMRATFGCCRLVQLIGMSRGVHIDRRIDLAVVLDLGVRSINSCGAAGLLILAGYWSPAAHHFRDIIESHQLCELFRLQPSLAKEWAAASGKARNRKFGFGRVREKLLKEPGAKDLADLKYGFDFYSNAGSHPSIEGLSFHMAKGVKNIGPTVNEDLFRIFSADLWAYMTRSTLRFVDVVETLMPNHAKITDEFRFETAVVEGAYNIFGSVSAPDLLAGWK